ncbi:MAG: glycosyltransferase family 2 protein [SAR324 cluster bacterium]|nr:glycosyltransferase family 2 protein [SAR324 cluster bacterium]
MCSISAVILTKNEEINLNRCIESVRWCREIVVVDSGSTDRTFQLAKSLGASVISHIQAAPFQISVQRNWALKNCSLSGDWVLFLDADETIPKDLASEIKRICSLEEQTFNAFELTPRFWFWGKWLKRTQGYPNWHARLLKRDEVQFAGGVWEHFASGARVGRIDIPYDHFANSKGFSDWLERHERYAAWDAEHIDAYLKTNRKSAFATERKLKLRSWAARFWPFRPLFRFAQMFLFRCGFMEGKVAFIYSVLCAFYEFMIVIKIIELRRKHRQLPL